MIEQSRSLRDRTAAGMTCSCGQRIFITPSDFLACEDLRCGRLRSPLDVFGFNVSFKNLREAWPDRSIERDKPISLPRS